MTSEVIIYTREGCGLCEQMCQQVERFRARYAFTLEKVDIDKDPVLQRRFNEKVPVLACDGEILCNYHLDESLLEGMLSEQ